MIFESINESNLSATVHLINKLWPETNYQEEYENCIRILENDKETILLAKEASHYLGFIYLNLRTDYVEGTETSPVAYIEGIYIEPEYRKKGIAAELVEKGAAWGKAKGALEYASDVEIHNEGSIAFHKSLGFQEFNRVVCFAKRIE